MSVLYWTPPSEAPQVLVAFLDINPKSFLEILASLWFYDWPQSTLNYLVTSRNMSGLYLQQSGEQQEYHSKHYDCSITSQNKTQGWGRQKVSSRPRVFSAFLKSPMFCGCMQKWPFTALLPVVLPLQVKPHLKTRVTRSVFRFFSFINFLVWHSRSGLATYLCVIIIRCKVSNLKWSKPFLWVTIQIAVQFSDN